MRALAKHVANQVFALLLLFGSASAKAEKAQALLDRLPLSFEANAGQFDARVHFLARAHGKRLFLVREGMVLLLDPSRAPYDVQAVVRIEFNDASKRSSLEGVDRLAATTNYFRSGQNIADVPNFLRVRQREVYPGVDVLYYGNQGRLEYDFIVAPGGDPKRISLRISGHDALRITEAGDLVLTTIAGDLVMKRPAAYQEREGERLDVPVRYAVTGNELRFEVAAYNHDSTLVIDPLLAYSSFLGGSAGSVARAIALDAAGNIYVTGHTGSTDFPLVGAFQTKLAGTTDGFVTKISASGTARVYSTYIGGRNGHTFPRGIAVDSTGSAYITGETTSTAYPVTSGAYRTSAGASTPGFATKFSPQGNALAYSTFIPGGQAKAIAVTAAGNAVITGQADGLFTTTPGVVQPNSTGGLDAYVLQLNAAGTAAVYSTRLGGQADDDGRGVALDSLGRTYVTGSTKSSGFPLVNPFQSTLGGNQDAFVAQLDAAATALVYSTYLGGSLSDSGNAIALDAQGNAYIGGTTYSLDFPVLRAFQSTKAYTGTGHEAVNQAFITKLAPSGQTLVYSSYLGGRSCLSGGGSCDPNGNDETALAIAVDAAGIAYLAGMTRSITYPQVDAIQSMPGFYANSIPFVARVQDRANATLLYSVALGEKSTDAYPFDGEAAGVAVDAAGNAYAAGYVVMNFPVTPGALSVVANAVCCNGRAVIFKLSPGAFPTTLSASSSQPTSSDPVTLTAVVTSAVPGGQVTFFENGDSIATVSVSAGVATYTTVFNAGVRELTAVYSGDNKMSRPLFLPVKQAASN